ncbi:MAG: hypothetical protein H7Z11_20270 [Verrucomicrobia bacterium]|nr:hypothetical protein [Leptolyngbya sp. ES-bin-22]
MSAFTHSDQTRLTNLARIRGGLHDMGLTMKSPQTVRWTTKALDRLQVSYSQTESGSLTYLLPDSALEAMATAIEKKLLEQSQGQEAA